MKFVESWIANRFSSSAAGCSGSEPGTAGEISGGGGGGGGERGEREGQRQPLVAPRMQMHEPMVTSSLDSVPLSYALPSHELVTVEWHMMDKNKFFPLSMISSFSIRCFLYPFTVIKTRIQIQKHKTVYNGTFDAFRKTLRFEGFAGLYKGFWVNTIQIVSSVFYVMTYESVRHVMANEAGIKSSQLKALVAGGMASVVAQTIIVPFDVISQHIMVIGQPKRGRPHYPLVNYLDIKDVTSKSKWDVSAAITKRIYDKDGLRGFYRGYCASLGAFVPNGALWWWFYHFYSDQLSSYAPVWAPELAVRCFAAPLSGISSSVITNPLDIVRARFQVQRLHSYFGTFYVLWQEERLGIFTKGLSARLIQSFIFSFFLVLGYETIKRLSLHDEYKDRVRW